ncbi:MAG: type II toxin-antitoxin system death-on-curing family toxin [Anaerolineae bacterium]|nr:type II toxin-antitoxin system death-on-curing family toxin [Anaerolineae bacterium]
MTRYLTPEQVLFIHSRLVIETGGSHGLRDMGMLLSALGRPQATFDAADLYHDIFLKAAALMDSLVRNHPFMDANKRTALVSTILFLQLNGYRFNAANDEVVVFTLACARSELSIQQIAAWLHDHARV